MFGQGSSHGVHPSYTVPYGVNFFRRWGRSGATFGAAGFLAVAFFTDWKDVLQFVPVINDRFKPKDD